MAFDQADLEALGQILEAKAKNIEEGILSKVEGLLTQRDASAAATAAENAVVNRVSVVGKPDVDPEAGPKFYVHLANGDVVESYDSSSTHMAVEGSDAPVLVIGRYQIGE